MNVGLLLVIYFAVAAIVVLFSIKCADYVDMIDKKTNISGAFIGGVILAAVTSLPEVVTSISSIAIGNTGLIIGNVLGSDLFNLCIFGILTLIAVRGYKKAKVGTSHVMTIVCTILAYLVTGAVLFFDFGVIGGVKINIASIIIVILYAISCKFMASDDSESENEDDNELTIKQVVIRFVLCALGLVISSVAVTCVTDILAEELSLGSSVAGALFLGVATSIPELTSSIALVRKGNFNAMIGNVLGSNMFNYIIFSLADIIAFGEDVYKSNIDALGDSQLLIIFGLISTLITLASLFVKRLTKPEKKGAVAMSVMMVCGFLILASYAGFLICSI